jgi:O-antigen/teichoic acid export membrane protein
LRFIFDIHIQMGIVIRQSIKSVIITLGGVLLGALIAVLSTRFFPKNELGFRENLIKVSIWVSYLAIFGFNYTVLIFGQKYPPGHEKRSSFLAITGIIPLVFSVVVSMAFFIMEPYLSEIYNGGDAVMMHQYIWLFPILTLLSSMIGWMEGYLQSLHKTALQNLAREVIARVIYIILIILFALQIINFHAFIWLYVIFYLIPFFFLLYIAMSNPGFHFNYKRGVFSSAEIKEIFRFSGYHMLTVASAVLILQLDVFLLGPLGGLEQVAVYSIATLAISMLRNPTRVIGIAATPAFTKSYNEGDMAGLRDLFSRSSINMQIIGVCMFVLTYINIDNIQDIMAIIKGGYNQIKPLIMILMIGQLFDMITGLNFELIGVSKYYRFNFWIALLLLALVFILNYFMIKEIGIYGAAWATTIGLIIFNIAKTFFLWNKMNIQPFSKATIYVLIAGAIVGFATWIIPYLGNVFVDAICRSTIFALLMWFVLYRIKASPELNDITDNLIHKRRFY